jgi:hypothetical protein
MCNLRILHYMVTRYRLDVVLHQSVQMYARCGGRSPRILKISTVWRLVVGFTFRLLDPQGKNLLYLLDCRFVGLRAILLVVT